MKTKAAVLYGIGKPLVIEELEVPELMDGQVLVRILASGVCHSQLNEIRGNKGEDRFLPHTLGHEASGIVVNVGDGVSKVKSGDYVALTWIKGSGIDVPSSYYQKGGQRINSGAISTFLEYAIISENRIVKIPEKIPPAIGALLGCAVPTGAGIIKNNIKAKPGSSVAIFGVGGIGMSAIAYAASIHLNPIIAVDIVESKLEAAKLLGATHTINALKEDPVWKIKSITGKGVDAAVESSGVKEVMEKAVDAINYNGIAVIAGNPRFGTKISIDPYELIKGKRVMGTWGGQTNPDNDIPMYADMYLDGQLNLDPLISNVYSLEGVNEALDDLSKGNVLRAVIDMAGRKNVG